MKIMFLILSQIVDKLKNEIWWIFSISKTLLYSKKTKLLLFEIYAI